MAVWKPSATSTPMRRVRVNASRIGTDVSVAIGPMTRSQPRRVPCSTLGSPKEPSDWLA